MLKHCRIRRNKVSGVVPMPVRNLFRVVVRFPFRVVVMVIISMIQALDGHLSLMCPGASYRFAEAATRAQTGRSTLGYWLTKSATSPHIPPGGPY